MITIPFLKQLEKKLKVGNLRSIHLNAIPGARQPRLDLIDLGLFNKHLPEQFIYDLTSNAKFKLKVSNTHVDPSQLEETEIEKLSLIVRKLNNIVYASDDYFLEHGVKPFGFGFPLLVKRTKNDPNKIIKAPILIWSVDIEKSPRRANEWNIIRDDDYSVSINPLLQSHLQIDEQLEVKDLEEQLLDKGYLSQEEITEWVNNLQYQLGEEKDEEFLIENCFSKDKIETLTGDIPWIRWSGVLGMFLSPKESIVSDIEKLVENYDDFLFDKLIPEPFQKSTVSGVDTDPSQERIINNIGSDNKIIIQGPPGTGKSQSLTAIITNALENKAKVLVVCEKKTALEVIKRNLSEIGISNLCTVIDDVNRDRKNIINRVRERIESNVTQRGYNPSTYNADLRKFNELKESITQRHNNIHTKVFGDFNWKEVIGLWLSSAREIDYNKLRETLDGCRYDFSYENFSNCQEIVNNAKDLFEDVESLDSPFNSLNEQVFNQSFSQNHEIDLKKILIDRHTRSETLIQKLDQNIELFGGLFDRLDRWNRYILGLGEHFSKKIAAAKAAKLNYLNNYNKLLDKENKRCFIPHKFKNVEEAKNISDLKKNVVKYKTKIKNMLDVFENYRTYHYWMHFILALKSSENKLVLNLAKNYQIANWEQVFKAWFYHMILLEKELGAGPFHENESLMIKLTALNTKLRLHQIKKIRKIWHDKQDAARNNFRKKASADIKVLYNYRRNKKFGKRNSLRKIIHYDFDLFTSFFPVVLVNPVVCSSIMPLKEGLFDIVIFDEASQLRLEDTIPALIRGNYKIISGDRHQMPPSSYFSIDSPISTKNEDQSDEESLDLGGLKDDQANSESLLEYGDNNEFTNIALDFHYRSKHPYLIDFSNAAFYGSKLVPMPNKFNYKPIRFLHVDGIYKNRSNELEAKSVVNILFKHLKPFKDGRFPSVGVATLNINQRNLIKDSIKEHLQFHPDDQSTYDQIEEAGFFVKNLENVQGDEKDIIIISTTFGRDENDFFRQNFGPLNQSKGYRLLNVIISRAKYKLFVCTSIPKKYYMNYPIELNQNGNNGKGIFYAYLAYAESIEEENDSQRLKILNELSEDNEDIYKEQDDLSLVESPFEHEVYEVLNEILDRKDIIPQYKCGGFRIDFVIENEKLKNKIAIECDGATYHNTNEAYAWDNFRQIQLEELGFEFYRIYSTNWFQDVKKERNLLQAFLDKKMNDQVILQFEDVPEQAIFIDDIIEKDEETNHGIEEVRKREPKKEFKPERKKKRVSRVKSIVGKELPLFVEIKKPSKDVVKKDSIVHVRNLQNNQKIKLKFTEIENHFDIKNPGTKTIHINTALAQALLGKELKEKVQLRGMEVYYEIEKIESKVR